MGSLNKRKEKEKGMHSWLGLNLFFLIDSRDSESEETENQIRPPGRRNDAAKTPAE